MMNRRSFFKALAAVTASLAVPVSAMANIVPFGVLDTKPTTFVKSKLLADAPFIQEISECMEKTFFEFNDFDTREKLIADVISICKKYNIEDYYIVCNEANNPNEIIDANDLRLDIQFRIPMTDDDRYLQFSASRLEVSFKEFE